MAFQVRAEEAKAEEQDSPRKEDGKYDAPTLFSNDFQKVCLLRHKISAL